MNLKALLHNLNSDSKGQTAIFIIFVITVITTVILFFIMFPFFQLFFTHIFAATETIIDDANATAATISDENSRVAIQNAFQAESGSLTGSIDVLTVFVQYGYIFVIIVVLLVLFIITRRMVELQQAGGGGLV